MVNQRMDERVVNVAEPPSYKISFQVKSNDSSGRFDVESMVRSLFLVLFTKSGLCKVLVLDGNVVVVVVVRSIIRESFFFFGFRLAQIERERR
jgi:hypothetical protein